MIYKRDGALIAARLDKGEEVMEQLVLLAQKENISLASVSGIGAADRVELGIFDPAKKAYDRFVYDGAYEILSLQGNITLNGGKPFGHLHILCGEEGARVFGGHLFSARLLLTCELFITVLDAAADRIPNPDLGISQMVFR